MYTMQAHCKQINRSLIVALAPPPPSASYIWGSHWPIISDIELFIFAANSSLKNICKEKVNKEVHRKRVVAPLKMDVQELAVVFKFSVIFANKTAILLLATAH